MVGLEVEAFLASRQRIGSADLPPRAQKFTDPVAELALAKAHIEEIHYYIDTNQGINGLPKTPAFAAFNEMRSRDPNQLYYLELEVEGYRWFRGYSAEVGHGQLLLYTGWMHPHIVGGTPDPIVYTVGRVPQRQARSILVETASNLIDYIQERRIKERVPKSSVERTSQFPSLKPFEEYRPYKAAV